ncbi:type VII secretion target [Streptomyces sp. NPDC021100]|uniref:type VII secretion target n=1 Tax=Streptomyces sp. NPDC021100 TaxID=3365114 RepID=UPI0037A62580
MSQDTQGSGLTPSEPDPRGESVDISIETGYVRQGAGGTGSAAHSALENLRRSLDSSGTAADGGHGWASATALRQCAAAWENHMVDLARQMYTMADHLHGSANAYDATDGQATEALSRLHHGLSEFERR